MQQYLVRSGQNIYDVALSIYGNIEGIFDLLACNSWLNMDTRLSYGMTLNYHEEYITNSDIAIWLRENNILVKNGDHSIEYLDIEAKFKDHIEAEHPEIMQPLPKFGVMSHVREITFLSPSGGGRRAAGAA